MNDTPCRYPRLAGPILSLGSRLASPWKYGQQMSNKVSALLQIIPNADATPQICGAKSCWTYALKLTVVRLSLIPSCVLTKARVQFQLELTWVEFVLLSLPRWHSLAMKHEHSRSPHQSYRCHLLSLPVVINNDLYSLPYLRCFHRMSQKAVFQINSDFSRN